MAIKSKKDIWMTKNVFSTPGLKAQLDYIKDNSKAYDNLTEEVLTDFLLDLCKTKKGNDIMKDLEYWSIKDLGHGLYQCGNAFFGEKGLEEIDKAFKQKVEEYAK